MIKKTPLKYKLYYPINNISSLIPIYCLSWQFEMSGCSLISWQSATSVPQSSHRTWRHSTKTHFTHNTCQRQKLLSESSHSLTGFPEQWHAARNSLVLQNGIIFHPPPSRPLWGDTTQLPECHSPELTAEPRPNNRPHWGCYLSLLLRILDKVFF